MAELPFLQQIDRFNIGLFDGYFVPHPMRGEPTMKTSKYITLCACRLWHVNATPNSCSLVLDQSK